MTIALLINCLMVIITNSTSYEPEVCNNSRFSHLCEEGCDSSQSISINEQFIDGVIGRYHRSIYKYLDTGLPSLSLANGDPLKLTSPAQHASR